VTEAANVSFASYVSIDTDGDDDEDGGVRLNVNDQGTLPADANDGHRQSNVATRVMLPASDFASITGRAASSPHLPPSHPGRRGIQHIRLPIPVTPDNRSISFFDHTHLSESTWPATSDRANEIDFPDDATVTADLIASAEAAFGSWPPSGYPTPPAFPALLGTEPSFENSTDGPFTVYTFLAEDALPVDDPLRNYDFVEFMNDWRLQSGQERGLPAFAGNGKAITNDIFSSDVVLRDLLKPGAFDPQGIQWDRLGPSREAALRARRTMHPAGIMPPAEAFPSSDDDVLITSFSAESQYRFRSFAPIHRPVINHYQLRNSIAAISRNDIFYVADHSVVRTSLACPNYVEPIIDTSHLNDGLKVSCLSTLSTSLFSEYQSNDLLVAGGLNGEYVIFNTTLSSTTQGHITHADDGLITHVHNFLDRQSGSPRAAFCSNDYRLHIMDLDTAIVVASHHYPDALNCSATSPDGRLRALVGDTPDALISAAESGEVIVSLAQHADFGFACAWNPEGRYLATASQDCTVAVWDARNWSRPVRVMEDVVACARSLHYTNTGALVVVEDDDLVSIYHDPATSSSRQDINLFGAIAGVAVLDGGNEIVIANADGTVGGLMAYQQIEDIQASSQSTFANVSTRDQRWSRSRRNRGVGCLDMSLL
jgi:WD40 repeat protein